MTQEELDALMSEDVENITEDNTDEFEELAKDYRPDPKNYWPPAPPSKENKVVHQLDDVTKESEEKATQLFDMLDAISQSAAGAKVTIDNARTDADAVAALVQKLHTRFPDIATFANGVESLKRILDALDAFSQVLDDIEMNTMNAMDTMQYQDIHRQKIERVINVMRSLSNYMNKLFEGKIDDEKRVSSAKHIHGDENGDLVGDDDIEALIAAFGKK